MRRISLVLAAGLVLAGPAPASGGFTAHVDNAWFPLAPGTTLVYRGVKDGQPSRDVVRVAKTTRTIDGAPCATVYDRLYVNGKLRERTTDWYSQDAQGNVWYFGEATVELDVHGRVTSSEGSWLAGRHGAKAGIFMFAHPKAGRSARQEYLKGHAEDHFVVLGVHRSVQVPAATSANALLTKEWTPLEPGTIDHKYYVRGIGTVLEQTVKGGDERNALVSIRRP